MGHYGLSDKEYEIMQRIVRDDVIYCQSSLVDFCLENGYFDYEDKVNMYIDNSDTIKQLKEDKELLDDEIFDLDDEIEALEFEISDLQDELAELDSEDAGFEFNTSRLNNSIDKGTIELVSKKDRIKANTTRIEEIESEISDLESEQETPQEVFEWYLVTDWLAGKLRDRNEVMLENDYGTWWGRGCTGQSIELDSVIHNIAIAISRKFD